MKVSIGFHFIEHNTTQGESILNALNRAGITVDGNSIELVDYLGKDKALCRVWTESTLESYHEAADLLIALNNGGPVMFTATELTDLEMKFAEVALQGNEIDHHDDCGEDNEVFAYCESADHIRILSNALS